MVVWSETESGHGVTEGGSSGSPLFDPSGFIVGHLSGGRASCIQNELPDYYGKFSYSWASNGSDSSRQLKPWLDPINSGVQWLKGSDFDSTYVSADFTSNTTQVRVGQSVEYYNRSDGNITSYEWRFQGGEPSTSEAANPPTIRYNSSGKFDVGLYVQSPDGNDSLVKKEYIHVLPILSPNPSAGDFRVMFGENVPDKIDISVTDAVGKVADYNLKPSDGKSVTIDLSNNRSGLYLIRITTNGTTEILKAVLYND
jgi:PKD repeat protein